MKLSRKIITILIAAGSLSLAGLILIQARLLVNAWDAQKETFRQNARAALASASQQLANREVAIGIFSVADSSATLRTFEVTHIAQQGGNTTPATDDDSLIVAAVFDTVPFRFEHDTLTYHVPDRRRVIMRIALNGRDSLVFDSTMPAGMHQLPPIQNSSSAHSYMYQYECDNDSLVMMISHSTNAAPLVHSQSADAKRTLVRTVLDKLVNVESLPIERRVDSTFLDSALTASFADHGITLEGQWGILDVKRDSLTLTSHSIDTSALQSTWLRTRLYPQDILATKADLLVYFPDESSFVLAQVVPQFTASGLFMLIVIVCFAYTIKTMLAQRRFADLTVGFINNMTHEFKTPISTISLACQALEREDIGGSQEQASRYRKMIASENQRMRDHVEKILQMAVLEESTHELTRARVDMHELIGKAATHVSLQVEANKGTVAMSLQASACTVSGDASHLTNVIVNVLDNAVKYAGETVAIKILTWNPPGLKALCVRIEDSGIGISPKDIANVFDKYYRVQSGDIHNVKGFGIGLSYVKLMIEAHGGHIRIESAPRRGTAVEFTLPVTTNGSTE